MNSGNGSSRDYTLNNNAEAVNTSGGSGNIITQNNQKTISNSSADADIVPSATVLPGVKRANKCSLEPHEDGCGPSKPTLNVESAGNLILRKRDFSFYSNPPKAYALILNIFHYEPYWDEDTQNLVDSTRYGSEVDVENLAGKFKSFNVGVYTPETKAAEKDTVIYVEASDVNRWIEDFKSKVGEHKKESGDSKMACFVCIMGHGGSNACLIDSKHNKISLEKEIFSQFSNQYFRPMINNPKIFFTNCCRGNDPSPRVTSGLATDGISGKSPETVPHVEDFLIGWSTCPENFSSRDVYDGSIFIRVLCQLLQQHLELLSLEMNKYFSGTAKAKKTDLETILRAVADRMRGHSFELKNPDKSIQNCSQTPSIDNRGFAHFRWHVDHFEYSREDWLPSYLKLSQEDRRKLRLS